MFQKIRAIRAKISRLDFALPFLLIIIVILFILMHDLRGGTLLDSSAYNSYTRQALAWRSGQMHLQENVKWLELAIFEGEYWVSFPPVPSVFMLPLTFIFGMNTPDNIVMLALVLLSVTAAYLCCKDRGYSSGQSTLVAVGVVLGSNLFNMSMEGAVWFMAQSFSFCFCMWAIYGAIKGRFCVALLLIALALGCRPFCALLALPLFAMFLQKTLTDSDKSAWKKLLKVDMTVLPAILIGLALMLYNYARFNNGFEFGHSYLPEFNRGEMQFSLSYILRNLKGLCSMVSLSEGAVLNFTKFNGFFPLIANPIFIILIVEAVKCTRRREWTLTSLITVGAMLLNFLFLLCHRTFGGHQFGARYMVDLIPYTFLFLICLPKRKIHSWTTAVFAFSFIFNLYGALAVEL